MEEINIHKIVYMLCIEDLMNVANEELGCELTLDEIKKLEDKVGDYIDWYGAIQSAIQEHIKS